MLKQYRIAIPLTMLVLLWITAVIGQWLDLPSLDRELARMLNGMVGDSAGFDLTMIFMTREPGEILGTALVIYFYCRILRRSFPFAPFSGRIISHLLLLAILATFAYELMDVFNSTIARISPSESLPGFNDAMSIYKVEVDIEGRSEIVPTQAVMLYLPVFIALFRTRRFHLGALLLPLPILLSRVIIGIDWPSGFAAGFLCAWLFAAIATVNPLNRFYQKFEVWFDALWSRCVLVPSRGFYARNVEALVRPEANIPFHASKAEKSDYLDEPLRQHLIENWGLEQPVSINPPYKDRIYKVIDSNRTYIYKICRENESEDPDRPRMLEKMAMLREAGHMFGPAIFKTRDGGYSSRLDGRLTYLMEWVKGHSLNMATPPDVESVSRLLAQFHKASEPYAGNECLDPVEQFNIWALRFKRKFARFDIQKNNNEIDNHWFLKLLNPEKRRSETLFNMASYYLLEDSECSTPCLIHGDAHPLNYLRLDDGSLLMIDTERTRTGYGFEDLSALLLRYMTRFRWDFEIFRGAFDAYLKERPLPRHEIVLLLADMLYPHRYLKVYEKETKRSFNLQSLIRLLRKALELRSTSRKRKLFFIQAAIAYKIPFVGAMFDPEFTGQEMGPADDPEILKKSGPEMGSSAP